MDELQQFELRNALVDHVVKTTQHVVMIDEKTDKPASAGSGCLMYYKERLFFITVQHVADKNGFETCIDLGHPNLSGNSVFRLGTMNFIDEFKVNKLNTPNQQVEFIRALDIAYTEVKDEVIVLQKEMHLKNYTVTKGLKHFHISETDELPNKEECYSFYGRVRSSFDGWILTQTPSLFLCIQYDCRVGYFERFILHETINDPLDFKGTSGAPIISESGEIVAFVSGGIPGTNHLYGFSSAELKKFLDIYIDQHPVETMNK